MKVIVIEDEPLARKELIGLLKAFNDVEVVDECGDVFSALRSVRKYEPDVMFLDIILPGHDGFTLLDYMDTDEYRPHVVVVSGGPSDFAVRAFGEGVLDYLAKPVEEERLIKTIERVREQLSKADKESLPYPNRRLDVIPCIFNRRIKFIKLEEVEFVRSDATTGVRVVCQDNEYYTELILKTLVQKTNLVQCQRQYLFALSAVDEYRRLDNGLGEIQTHSQKVVPVARSYRNDVEKALGLQKD
jgi:two-component system LytT family response regulator